MTFMSAMPTAAWIEDFAGNRSFLEADCPLGRSGNNQLVVADPLVSHRHALIQRQGEMEYWLVDFGSRNGTYLNGRRITQPTRLRDGDRLRIGASEFGFHQRVPDPVPSASPRPSAAATLFDVRQVNCWLLVADIVDSTDMVARLPPGDLPLVTGEWLAACRDTLERHGGRVNQFMGDGFFAYWRDHPGVETAVAAGMRDLRRQQSLARPPFRFVLHLAPVVFGGVAIGEEERISGPEVHFVFRMEKLAAGLGISCLLSEAARARLAGLARTEAVGNHVLPGFPGSHPFLAWIDDA